MRQVISESQILQALESMRLNGEKITLRSLRERVGGGSYDRLLTVMRQYELDQARQQAQEDEQQRRRRELPQVILQRGLELQRALLAELWSAAQEQAEQQLSALREQVELLARVNQEIRERQEDDVACLGAELAAVTESLEASLAARAEMQTELVDLRAENKVLRQLLQSLGVLAAPAQPPAAATGPTTSVQPPAAETVAPGGGPGPTATKPDPTTPGTSAPAAPAQPPAAATDSTTSAQPPAAVPKKQRKTRTEPEISELEQPSQDKGTISPGVLATKKAVVPNQEQEAVVNQVKAGTPIIIICALAGTGKTQTLRFVADSLRDTSIGYVVFNARNAQEAQKKMPKNVKSMTAHSLAYHSLHPFGKKPMHSFFGQVCSSVYPQVKSVLERQPGKDYRDVFVISEAITNFCHSADKAINKKHLPAIIKALPNKMDPENYVKEANRIFNSLIKAEGEPVAHDIYLKLCSLHPPVLPYDLILVDEAQDLNPCMLSIIEHQIKHGKRLVLVGDKYQHIYSFTGAVDSMEYFGEKYKDACTLPLTASYRFGPEIAEAANCFLRAMGCTMSLKGLGQPGSVSDSWESPSGEDGAIIYRTNTSMIIDILGYADAGVKIEVVGGVTELQRLLQAVSDLRKGKKVQHREIGFFNSYQELQEFADTDAGSHLLPVIRYVENGDVDSAIMKLEGLARNAPKKGERRLTLTTGHKAKGLEFASVSLNSDMKSSFFVRNDGKGTLSTPESEELSLIYVAATRAKNYLYANGIFSLLWRVFGIRPAGVKLEAEVRERAPWEDRFPLF